jgi:hypothetical protein
MAQIVQKQLVLVQKSIGKLSIVYDVGISKF